MIFLTYLIEGIVVSLEFLTISYVGGIIFDWWSWPGFGFWPQVIAGVVISIFLETVGRGARAQRRWMEFRG